MVVVVIVFVVIVFVVDPIPPIVFYWMDGWSRGLNAKKTRGRLGLLATVSELSVRIDVETIFVATVART